MRTILPALAAALLLSQPAHAQACGPREPIIKNLQKKYGEAKRFIGFSEGALLEVWVNEETGTWTATTTAPNGVLCIRSAGRDFEFLGEQTPGEPT